MLNDRISISKDYIIRHDEVARCLHLMFAKRYGITKKRKMKNYKIQSVLSNEHVKIKFDTPIITELRLDHNKPDIMVHDKRARKIWLIEVGITHKNILSTTETTKARKYESLANELKCLNPGTEVVCVPVVLTWDGLVTHHFKRYMDWLRVDEKIQAYIQTQVLQKTCQSVMIDTRRDQEWQEEDIIGLMDQLDSQADDDEVTYYECSS